MDPMLLRLFQRQIKFQCDCALIAAQELDAAIAKRNITAVFAAVQSLLGAAANISKALWGGKIVARSTSCQLASNRCFSASSTYDAQQL
jgi:hypothetical protein